MAIKLNDHVRRLRRARQKRLREKQRLDPQKTAARKAYKRAFDLANRKRLYAYNSVWQKAKRKKNAAVRLRKKNAAEQRRLAEVATARKAVRQMWQARLLYQPDRAGRLRVEENFPDWLTT